MFMQVWVSFQHSEAGCHNVGITNYDVNLLYLSSNRLKIDNNELHYGQNCCNVY